MKIADCHMHSFFSSDSEAPTEEMVKRAVELGLPAICLTDHYDMDYSTGEFQLDTPAYAAKIRELQEKYRGRIDIRFGVELGLQLHLKERMEEYVNAWPFDYVIGSMHVIDGKDPIMRMLSRTGQQKSCTGRIFGLQQKISGSSTISRRLVIWIMWYATAEKREKITATAHLRTRSIPF